MAGTLSPSFFLMKDAFFWVFSLFRHLNLASRIDNAFLHSFKATLPKNPRIIPASFQKPEIDKRIMQLLAGTHTLVQEGVGIVFENGSAYMKFTLK
jgi:hypothetical protein